SVPACVSSATGALCRSPFLVHTDYRWQGLCAVLVHIRGRGTSWLSTQREGAALDILGPMGHGWEVRSTVRNLLLVSEGSMFTAVTLLAQSAIEQELAVTLVGHYSNAQEIYPPALLPSEVEYHIVTTDGSVGQ